MKNKIVIEQYDIGSKHMIIHIRGYLDIYYGHF